MNCPICGRESDGLLCPDCGFDASRDYELHPTFAPLSGIHDARSRLRDGMLRCPECNGSEFRFLYAQGSLPCRRCGRLLSPQELEPVLRALNCAPVPAAAPEPAPVPLAVPEPVPEPSDVPRPNRILAIAAGMEHTVALYDNGTVRAIGRNESGACDLADWRDIAAIAAGDGYTLGLKRDGTVVAAGSGYFFPGSIAQLQGVTAIAAGENVFALTRSGTVSGGPYDWKDITAIAAGDRHVVGLKQNGTVVASLMGGDDYDQCDVSTWRRITAVAAGFCHTVGLRSNGTVMAAGQNRRGECNTGQWRDIAVIAAGGLHTLGLKQDGTVVATGWNLQGQCDVRSWSGIRKLCAGWSHTVGLRLDGSLIATGNNSCGQCDVHKLAP